jgi:hypothetical protein
MSLSKQICHSILCHSHNKVHDRFCVTLKTKFSPILCHLKQSPRAIFVTFKTTSQPILWHSQNKVLTPLLSLWKQIPHSILCHFPTKFWPNFVSQYLITLRRKYKLPQITVSRIPIFCTHQVNTEQLIIYSSISSSWSTINQYSTV